MWLEFFKYSRHKSCIRYMTWKDFFLIDRLSLHFLDGTLWSITIFNFYEIKLIYFFFLVCAFGDITKKPLPSLRSWRFAPMFSSKLQFLCDIFDLFWVIFVYGVKESNYILSHMDIQLSQYHWLKKQFFLHWIVLTPLSNINWYKSNSLFLVSQIDSIDL